MKHDSIIFYLSLYIFITALTFISWDIDCDFWQRLLQGEYVFNHLAVMPDDPFSYVKTHKYIDYEWGSGVIFYAVLKHFGYTGEVVLKAILMSIMTTFIILTIKLKGLKNTKISNILFFFLLINCFEALIITGIRCQFFTFMLFSAFLFILEYVRKTEKYKFLFILPLLSIFWANLHGGSVAGIGLVALYITGEALNKKPIKYYFYTLAGVCTAHLINPYGFDYVVNLFKSVTMDRSIIAEWQNIFELESSELVKSKIYTCFAFITAVFAFFKDFKYDKKIDFTKYIVLAVLFFEAFSHIKHIPLMIIGTTIFLYDDFFGFFNLLLSKIRILFHITSEKFINAFVILKEFLIYLFIIISGTAVIYCNFDSPISEKSFDRYPVKIVEFMKINNLKGAILNNFGIGSYLAYKLYPQNRIYTDGRYEALYYEDTTNDNIYFYYFDKKFDNVFKKEGFPQYIIIAKDDAIYPHTALLPLYKKIFEENKFILLGRIDVLKDKYLMPTDDFEYYIKTCFDKI